MTIQYKNQGFKQTDTSKTTAFTCPTDATVIVKSVYCANNDASSAILVNMNLVDSSDSSTNMNFSEMMLQLNHKLMLPHKV